MYGVLGRLYQGSAAVGRQIRPARLKHGHWCQFNSFAGPMGARAGSKLETETGNYNIVYDSTI